MLQSFVFQFISNAAFTFRTRVVHVHRFVAIGAQTRMSAVQIGNGGVNCETSSATHACTVDSLHIAFCVEWQVSVGLNDFQRLVANARKVNYASVVAPHREHLAAVAIDGRVVQRR